MREIRFRAWDGHRFYYFSNHAYTLDYNDISGWNVHPNTPDYRGEWTTGESSRSAEKFDLQQFTGLLDRNNKDIYEGDIIHRPDIGIPMLVRWNEENAGFDLAMKDFKNFNAVTLWYTQYCQRDYEIIGNIHEHPNLLEGQQND